MQISDIFIIVTTTWFCLSAMCNNCLWCARRAALGCELRIAWGRKPSSQVLQDVERKAAHQSDDGDFPQEWQSCNEVNICIKISTKSTKSTKMGSTFWEEVQKSNSIYQRFVNCLTFSTFKFKAHTIPGPSLFCPSLPQKIQLSAQSISVRHPNSLQATAHTYPNWNRAIQPLPILSFL